MRLDLYPQNTEGVHLLAGLFAEFAESDLAGRMHEALIKETLGQGIVGHVSRDSTVIPAREEPTRYGAFNLLIQPVIPAREEPTPNRP